MKKSEAKQRITMFALLAATPGLAVAGPQGANIIAGSASVSHPSTHGTVINQSSAKAIINWQSFSIGVNEYVQFKQPDSNSISLNRVVGSDPSAILGNLTANGQVFLVNPNGIFFGAGATLDVGGLVASTLDIKNDDFLNGNYVFTAPQNTTASSVVNAGVIQARESGYVVLMGEHVENNGNIKTKFGKIALLAGGEVTLDINGDGLVSYSIDAATATELAGVENTGQLAADGGRVILAGRVSDELVATAVNNRGLIQANGIEERNGEIYLIGNTDVYNSGTINASGKSGGTISIQGKRVAQQGIIHADASDADGGNVSITADEVIALTKSSLTTANAGNNGKGGDVIVYTTGSAIFNYGARIEAKGGSASGDGGFVEVSGLDKVEINGFVDASAMDGAAGTFLIDPTNIKIVSANTADVDLTDPGSGDPRVFENDGNTDNEILDTTIEGLLNGGTSVTLQTADTGAGDGGDAGDITVDAQIDKTAGGTATLTLQADNDIILNQDIVSTTGALNVVLEADNDITFNIGADIISNGGDVTITADVDGSNSGEQITMADGTVINAASGKINLSTDDDITIGQLITTDTSTTSVQINSANGSIQDAGDTGGADITSAGRLIIKSETGIGASGNQIETNVEGLDLTTATGGIYIKENDDVTIAVAKTTTSGDIDISANGKITVSDGDDMAASTAIQTAGTGSINLDSTSANNDDIEVRDGIQSVSGNISIVANDSITFTDNGDITSTSGMITVTADANGNSNGNDNDKITMSTATVFNAGSGAIDLNSDGDVAVAQLTTSGAVNVDATNGDITGVNGSTNNVTGSTVTLTSKDGIGTSSNALETAATTLDLTVTNTGDINIDQTGDVDLAGLDTADGDISITASGAITTSAAVSATDGDIVLATTSNGDVNLSNAISATTAANGNRSISINASGNVMVNAALTSSVGGNGDASISIGSMGSEVASVSVGVSGSLNVTEGGSGDSETIAIYASGAIDTANTTLNANDGVTLSGGGINAAAITASTGTVSVVADTNNVVVTNVSADAISITNSGASNGDITIAQLDADNGGITVNAAGALSAGTNTITATGAIDLDGASVVSGNINSSASSVDVNAASSNISVGTVDADSNVVLNAATSLSTGDVSVTIDDISLTAGTTLALAELNNADNISLSAGGVVTSTAVNPFAASTSISLTGTGGGTSYNLTTNTAQLNLNGGLNSVTVDNTAFNGANVGIAFNNSGFGTVTLDTDVDTNVTGSLSATGSVDIDSANATLTSANTLSGATGVTLNGSAVTTAGLNASGGAVNVTADDGDVTLGAVSADSISISNTGMSNGDITTGQLDADNGAITVNAAGDLQIANANALLVAGATISLTGDTVTTGNIAADTTNGVVNVTGNAASGATIINSGDITAGTITLDADTITAASITTNSLTVQDGVGVTATDLTLSGLLTTPNANLVVSGALNLNNISATTGITLDADAINAGSLTATAGAVSVTADTGNITVAAVNADNINIVNTGATNGNITTAQLDADNGGITINAAGDLVTADVNALLATGAVVNLTGDTVTSGNILTNATTGTVNITANAASGTNTVNVGNVIASAVNFDGFSIIANAITANSFTIKDGLVSSNDLTLNGNLISGTSVSLDVVNALDVQDITASTGSILLSSTNSTIATGSITSSLGSVGVNANGQFNFAGNINAETGIALVGNGISGSSSGNVMTTTGNISATAATSDISIGNLTAEAVGASISVEATTGDASVGALDADTVNIIASSLTLNDNYTNGNFTATNTLTVNGTITNNNINLTAKDFLLSNTGTLQDAGVGSTININASDSIVLDGTVNVASGIFNATITGASGSITGSGTSTASTVNLSAQSNVGTDAANQLTINAATVNMSGTVANAFLDLTAANNALNINSSIANTLDVDATNLTLSGSSVVSATDINIVTTGNLNLAQSINASTSVSLNVAGSADNGGNSVTTNTLNLSGNGTYGSALSPFNSNATSIDIRDTVTSVVLDNAATTTTALTLSGGGTHGALDISALSDLNLAAGAAVNVSALSIDTTGALDIAQDITVTSLNVLSLQANGINSNGNTLTADTTNLSGTGNSSINVVTDSAAVNLGLGLGNVTIDTSATALSNLNLNAASYGDLTVASDGLIVNGANIATGNISINAGAGNITNNAILNAAAASGSTLVSLDTSGQIINNAAITATDLTSSSSIVIGGTTAVSSMSGTGQYKADAITINAINAATVTAVTNTGALNVNGGTNLNIDNTAFSSTTTFTYGRTSYTSLDLEFGGTTTLNSGGDIVATTVSLNGQSGLSLNQGYSATTIDITAGGQVDTTGVLTAATINLAGNGSANFGSSASKLMTNTNTLDLGVGINDVFIDNTMNTGNATLNFSGINYGVVDFDFGGTSSKVGVATTSTVQGNDFLASAFAISGNGNINVTAGFNVNGGTVPGVNGDTLLTSSIASVGNLINAGGTSDPNASFIATDAVTLNINNLSQSNQYLLIKADDISFTGTSNAANLLVQLTPFTISQTDMLGNTTFSSMSFNQTVPGAADFNYTFEKHFAPFTGTTIALGEQGFNGDIAIGNINAGTKNLLFLSGGSITGINNVTGTGFLGSADEVGGFFVVRPIVTTITADQLGVFGFEFGARVSTIELNEGFDAAGEGEKNKDDLELEEQGVNDGSEKQCS